MIYRKCTAGYISVHYFGFEKSLLVLSYKVFFGRDMLKNHLFKLKKDRLNNRDFNIDRINRDYDFSHNSAALT
jgi:hypothetical protein